MFTVNAILKHVGGSIRSQVLEPGRDGSRTLRVNWGAGEVVFADDAAGRQQHKFESAVSDALYRAIGYRVTKSSLPAMGIKLGMFKENGVPLLDSLLALETEAVQDTIATMEAGEFFKKGNEGIRPLRITGVQSLLVPILLDMGYVVKGDVAEMPVPDYQAAVDACVAAISAFLQDPEAPVLGPVGIPVPAEHVDGARNEEQDGTRRLFDAVYLFPDCSEEDLQTFMRIDRNLEAVRTEERIFVISRTQAKKAWGKLQQTFATLHQFLEHAKKVTPPSSTITTRQLLWLVNSRQGGMCYDQGRVGPKILQEDADY